MELEHCFCQYLKTNIAGIRLIPLDHVTLMVFVLFSYVMCIKLQYKYLIKLHHRSCESYSVEL